MRTATRLIGIMCLFGMLACSSQAGISAPKGAVVDRNIDLAAQNAIDQWITQLEAAPHTEDIQNIGILPLSCDGRDFTALLSEKLSAIKRYHVVILAGKDWNAVEDEMARTDPEGGIGDIMDKASIVWTNMRHSYVIPETTKGADALLLGAVRSVDTDWLRARVRFTLHLARVDTREQIGGGIAEGEQLMSWKDLVIYYKIEVLIGIAAIIGLLIVLGILRGIVKARTRPR